MTLQQLMPLLVQKLNRFPKDVALRDVRWLAAGVLDLSRDRLILHMHDELTSEQESALIAAVEARMLHMPVAKILGRKMFWGRDFHVDQHVLDPRPETEVLIRSALDLGPQAKVLDLGTGSGAIAVTLALEWSEADVLATDLSADALIAAEKNRYLHGVADTVHLLQSDWYADVSGQFDLIVSNPPYIAAAEMDDLSFDVRNFDPRMALTDESDGLTCYRIICAGAGAHLKPGGWLMVEIGPTQAQAVQAMMADAGLDNLQIRTDLDGRDRVVLGQNPPNGAFFADN